MRSITLDCMSAPFVRCVKEMKLSSDGGDLLPRTASEAIVVSGRACIWREYGVRRSILCWFQESGFSHHEDVTKFNLHKKKFHKFVLPMQFTKVML
jgi:hypothetical protein